MANSSLVLTLKNDRATFSEYAADASVDKEAVMAIAQLLMAAAQGCENLAIDLQYTDAEAPVAASGTITCASVLATHTVTIAGVTFTASSTPSGEAQFEIDGDDTADAAALAAKINAHSTIGEIVSATSALGVVTVTCKVKGVIGNFITLASTGGTMTLSAAALASGTGGAQSSAKSYSLGL